jgi:hypothetical protein
MTGLDMMIGVRPTPETTFFMHRRQEIFSIFAVFALVVGHAAGWVHVQQHSGGGCGCVDVCDAQQLPDEASSKCDSSCCVSPLRVRWLAKQAAEASRCSGSDELEHSPFGSPHRSDDCTICLHFMCCRDHAVASIASLTFMVSPPTTSNPCDDQVVCFGFAGPVYFLRGPPVA